MDDLLDLGKRFAAAILLVIATAAVFALTFADLSNPEGVIHSLFGLAGSAIQAMISDLGSK